MGAVVVKRKAKLENIAAMLVFGSVGIFVRYIPLASGAIAVARGLIGAGVLLIASLALKKPISWRQIKKNMPLLAISGAAMGLSWLCLFEAYRYTTIALATLIYYMAPVFMILLSPLVLKEKLTPLKVVCVALALLGAILITGAFGGRLGGGNNLLGLIFGTAAALLYVAVVFMNKFVREIRPIDSTFAQLLVAALALLPYMLLTENLRSADLGTQGLVMLLIVSVFHTGIMYQVYFSSIRSLDGQSIAMFSYVDPVTAVLLSALLLKERMGAWEVVGAVLILGSTLASQLLGPAFARWREKRRCTQRIGAAALFAAGGSAILISDSLGGAIMDNEENKTNEVLKAIKQRRSIRHYKPEQIRDEELNAVLEAGTYAPTGKNLQDSIIIVIQDKETIADLSRMNAIVYGKPGTDPFFGAPTVLLVMGVKDNINHVQDASCVMSNLMLAAYAVGLGSCWVNRARQVFDSEEGKAYLRKWGIDENKYEGVGHCVLGYPSRPHPTTALPRNEGYVIRV